MEVSRRPVETVGDAVVRAVSAFEDRPADALPPLDETIDTDALNDLCSDRHDGSPRSGCRISFEYDGCHVTVEDGESVGVCRIRVGSSL